MTVPLKLRIDINEDHAALDGIIREYSKRMGMSMTTFITEVLLDVLLPERKTGVFQKVSLNHDIKNVCDQEHSHYNNNAEKAAYSSENDQAAGSDTGIYGSSALIGSMQHCQVMSLIFAQKKAGTLSNLCSIAIF